MAPIGGSQSGTHTRASECEAAESVISTKAPPKPVAYYCQDFAWEELQKVVESNAALSHAWSSSVEDDLAISNSTYHSHGAREQCRESSLETRRSSSGVNRSGLIGTAGTALPHEHAWEGFHTKHTTARFFKERRYLLEEFPELKAGRLKILEVGCGSGSTAIPLLTGNPQTLLHACDCSPTAVAHTAAAVQRAIGSLEAARRFKGFCWDAALEPCPLLGRVRLEGLQETEGLEETERGRGGLTAVASGADNGRAERGGVYGEAIRGANVDLRSSGSGGEASGIWLGVGENEGIREGVWGASRIELGQQTIGEGNAERECGQQSGLVTVRAASMGGCAGDCDAKRPCTESDEHACTIVDPAEGQASVHTECTVGGGRNEPSSPPGRIGGPKEPGSLRANCLCEELEVGGLGDSESGADQVGESSVLQRGLSDAVLGPGDGFDFVTLIFTLSAVHPDHMPSLLRRLHQLLRPGGAILFRDYGLYDMTMLRFPPGQKVGDRLYRRLDGTLSYFFSKEALAQLATQAGFTVVDCEYCCVTLVNKRKGIQMKRVWLHARLQKWTASTAA
ncbi:methyltransferase family protein [Klebsormidium nitens]|uniref:Methyltransferase family protein n=1 Tax=Klebsormidium nitens TaxID=105231 RepID=A0A1Y1IG88_KLENI|nr:methyltransferase family protein [Klebsormidium nitens]|eukprot:GAQ89870.1 methyltransferase family protein [Klebsormidium nitens]